MATTYPPPASGPTVPPRRVHHFIGGNFVPSSASFDDISPVTGELLAIVDEASMAEVDLAVAAAREALTGPWGRMEVGERCALLHAVADRIEARFDEFLDLECRDTGKPRSLARHVDIPRGAANFRFYADFLKNVGTDAFPMATPDGAGAVNYAMRVPLGVVAVVCPWNLPLLLMTWKVAPALACGNTVIVKPSEETPLTASLLAEVMVEVGVPAGVYNVVNGLGPDSAGQYLTEHPEIDGITFTGETRTGEAILAAAAPGIRKVSMELGGKNPAIVFADCDMRAAVEGTLRSAFVNSGQVCLGTERIFVQRPIFNDFVAKLQEGAEAYRIGPPEGAEVDFGPLISRTHRDKVLSYYARAARDMAELVTGGGIPKMPGELEGGAWIEPTIWTGLPDDSAVNREEIFGPCCHVRPFDDEEEAVRCANDTPYGLAASIWTGNLSRGHRVAAQVDAGLCWVNSWFLRDLRTPFGGMKASGLGREGGASALEFYTELKNVCVKL